MARKTIRSRRLGGEIRRLREQARLNQEGLVELINRGQPARSRISQSQLSKVESGAARITGRQLRRIVEAVGTDAETAARLEALRARAEETGWWSEYSPHILQSLEMVVELEENAEKIRTYDAVFIQGLLQTEDYARAIIGSGRAFVRPIDVDTLVELRMRRQARLSATGFAGFTAILTEATLRHRVGTTETMRAQLTKLCDIVENTQATVRILRYDRGPWPSIGSFNIFTFPAADDGSRDDEVVYVDGDLGAAIYEDREAVNALVHTFRVARDRALGVEESVNLCRAMMREM